MKTKEERKARRQKAVAKLREHFAPRVEHLLRAPDAEDIQAALALSAAIGVWALSGFDPAKGAAIREAWEALEEERKDTPPDLRGLAEREQG
jgi:hypothetical protein